MTDDVIITGKFVGIGTSLADESSSYYYKQFGMCLLNNACQYKAVLVHG